MMKWVTRLGGGGLLALMLAASVAAAPTVNLGVIPNMETLELVRQYQPLASFLQEQLQVSVLVRTRATHDRFARAVAAGEFDLVITTPHLARLAEQRGDMLPLASFAGEIRLSAVLLEGVDLQALRAKPVVTVAVPDALSWVAVAGEEWLAQELPDSEIQLRSFRSHRNTIRALHQQEGDITFIGSMALARFEEEQLQGLTLIDTEVVAPHLVLLCRAAQTDLCEAAVTILERFPESPYGRLFFEGSQLQGWVPVPELSQFDALLQRVQTRLPRQ